MVNVWVGTREQAIANFRKLGDLVGSFSSLLAKDGEEFAAGRYSELEGFVKGLFDQVVDARGEAQRTGKHFLDVPAASIKPSDTIIVGDRRYSIVNAYNKVDPFQTETWEFQLKEQSTEPDIHKMLVLTLRGSTPIRVVRTVRENADGDMVSEPVSDE